MDKAIETFLDNLDFFLRNWWSSLKDKLVAQNGINVPPQNQDIEVLVDILEYRVNRITKQA